MTLLAGARLGVYDVIAPLGAGGMGEVYRARDARLARDVAIKVLPSDLAADVGRLKRFEKEARSASALNHPNIVTIYEIGSADSISYIAMELVEGKTLRELLLGGPLPTKRILQISSQIADGLARAHEAGIVHRDLKPENVMVTKDGRVKILDFGLAKLAPGLDSSEGTNLPTETGTSAGVILGTIGYMSPEQASGQPVDFRSDQFSFGSILYEMATGKRAFQKKTGAQTLAAVIQDEPEPIQRAAPQVPGPLRWIAEQCLSKDPVDRYASTQDLARELQRSAGHLADDAATGGARPRARASSLLGWGIAALLVVAAVALWFTGVLRTDPPSAPSFRRLTFQEGLLGMARFAPDGQTIVYSADWTTRTRRDVYLTRLGSPESTLLFPDTDLFSVSASGELAIMPGGERRWPTLLARVPLSGGAPREVVENVAYSNADWAPGGKELAIVRSVAGRNRLEFPIGKVIYESGEQILAPRFSPDGRKIAFFQNLVNVVSIDSDGKNRRVISSGLSDVWGVPCWMKAREEILFSASRGAEFGLRAVGPSGRERLVAQVPGNLELLDARPDGKALVAHHTTSVMMMGLAPGESEERELSWLDRSRAVDLSPDGRNILFAETGEGGGKDLGVYFRPTSGAPAKRLGDGFARGLSPDGRWVVASKGGRLWLLPTGPGEPKMLSETAFEDLGGADWGPDGKWIVFSALEQGRGERLYLQMVSGAPPRPISAEGVTLLSFGGSISPDGKLVVGLPASAQPGLVFAEQSGVPRLYTLDGSPPRSIPGLEQGEVPIQWSSDGRSLFVYKRTESPAKVWLVDLATGRRRFWREIRHPDRSYRNINHLLVTPDGNSYAYTDYRTLSTLYLVEGLK